jgi:hypothetical protein
MRAKQDSLFCSLRFTLERNEAPLLLIFSLFWTSLVVQNLAVTETDPGLKGNTASGEGAYAQP